MKNGTFHEESALYSQVEEDSTSLFEYMSP